MFILHPIGAISAMAGDFDGDLGRMEGGQVNPLKRLSINDVKQDEVLEVG